ncbi:transcriptional regulator, AraC family [[Clostridium] methylpentosum DSM 5476]|uniref:Transcriptional regulator, AraC family n=1 Tax=[Clostridium] methylpentosum DSM 5476 TaxID=537013 RepID=C0ECN2_9FIRM|nr:transcriptional regulator, AraC family [[Clostridium] methylpentosum DSM 5476]MDY3989528.1 AraC family transcriptional regulator [Massilioclostridium sp.]MEE1491660.1 AraC family transcriptional regulator [Massilioclostridium sp.]
MDLEAYATREKQKRRNFELELARQGKPRIWDQLIQQCKQNGYYVLGSGFSQSTKESIRVGVHGFTDVEDQKGYMHRHDYFEMIYVYRGGFVNVFPDHTVRMKQGDIMLLNPNILHAPYVERDDDIVFNIFISNPMIREKIIPLQKDNSLLISFFMEYLYFDSQDKKYLNFTDNSPDSILLTEKMIEEYIEQRPFYQNMTDAYLVLLFSQLSRDYYKNHSIDVLPKNHHTLSYDIINYIGQNCRSITLDSLAKHFQYTPNYLSRLIRQSTGKTFSQIVSQQKLQRAAGFITSTDMPIVDIGQIVGFYDVSHFIRSFKKEYHLTPAEYRKTFSSLQ